MTNEHLTRRILMSSYYMPSTSKIGVGHQVHALANALVARGHDVTVATPATASEGAHYRTWTIPVSGSLRTFRWAFALRRLDMTSYDVLHAHGDDYWLWRRRTPAHIRTMHGSCLQEARRVPGVKEKLRMVMLAAGEVLATFVADVTVAVSCNTTRTMPWIKTTIPNGVELARFQRAGMKRDRHPTILFVGTYANRKRGKLLLEVFTRYVQPAVPDARLWMVCDDAPRDVPGVEVLGKLSDEELAERYLTAWVFCLPSTYEGFGIPYIEAMAAGLPVVATPNPGAREVTSDGVAGKLVPDSKLGEELVAMLTDRSLRESFAALGRERVEARYGMAQVCSSYEALYSSVLEGGEMRPRR